MNKTLFASLTALVVLASFPGALADSRSGHYTGASPGIVGLTINLEATVPGTGHFGGVQFAGNGLTPRSVTATDASGSSVYLVACQDFSGTLCGEVGEPRATGCGSVDLSTSVVPFDTTHTTAVFVYSTSASASASVPSCVGTATSGTITLTSS